MNVLTGNETAILQPRGVEHLEGAQMLDDFLKRGKALDGLVVQKKQTPFS